MQVLDVFIAFISIIFLSSFFVLKCRVPAGFAPLSALCLAALWFSFAGVLGALTAGGIIWFVLCTAVFVFSFVYKKSENKYKKLFTPASMFFILACIIAMLYFAVRKPLLSGWDEYSLWATAVKLMKTSGELYTTAQTGWAWPATQAPSLPALSYLFQFFGAYSPWKIYTAYAVLYLAVISALIGNLSLKQYKIVVPLAIIALLTPWFFTVYMREYEPHMVWLSSYGDLPAGMLFGGTLLTYFGLRRAKAPLWPTWFILGSFALVKDNTMPIALLAAGLMACDLVFLGEGPSIAILPFSTRLKRRFAKRQAPRRWPQPGYYPLSGRLLRAAGFFAAVILPYMLWGRHVAKIVLDRIASGEPVQPSASPLNGAVLAFKMLVGAEEKTHQFNTALTKMLASLTGGKTTMIGNPAITIAFILVLFILSIVLTSHRRVRQKAALAMLISTAGFAAYFFVLLVSYGHIFKMALAESLEGFNRYTNSYFIGWFLLAVYFLALAARDGRPYGLASGITLVLAGSMIFSSLQLLPLQNSDIGYPSIFYKAQKAETERAQSVLKAAGGEGRIFFVSQGDDFGENWLHYHYQMFPMILDYSGISEKYGGVGGGGGTFGLPDKGKDVMNYRAYTPSELRSYISNSNCDFVFIESIDEGFVSAYSTLFADGLEEAIKQRTLLYKVDGEGAALRLSPVQMEVAQ